MAHDFPFDHFLKIGNKSSTPETFNNRFVPAEVQNTINLNSQAFQDEELSVINQEILNHLQTVVPELKFKTYFDNNLELKCINEATVCFEVKTAFIKKSVELYKDEITKALFNVLGTQYEVQIESRDQTDYQLGKTPNLQSLGTKNFNEVKFTLDLTPTREDLASKAQAQYIEHMNPNQSGIIIDRSKTFDNFIVGPTNNMAQAASKAVAQNPGKNGKYPSLYVHSNSGLGKTHLLHSVANEINEKHPSLTICLITARDFMDEMITLMKNNKIN